MGNGLDRLERTYLCSGSCAAGSCCLEKSEALKEMNHILGTDRRYEIRRSRSDTFDRQEVDRGSSDEEPSDPDDGMLREQTGERVFQEQTGGVSVITGDDPLALRESTGAIMDYVSQVRVPQRSLVPNSGPSGGGSVSVVPAGASISMAPGGSISITPWPAGPHSPRAMPGPHVTPVALRGSLALTQQVASLNTAVKRASSTTSAVGTRMQSSPCWTTSLSPRMVLCQGGSASMSTGGSTDIGQGHMRSASHGRGSRSSLSSDLSSVPSSAVLGIPALVPCTGPSMSAPLPQQQQRQQQQQQQQSGLPQKLQHEDDSFECHTPPPLLSNSVLAAAAAAAAAGRLGKSKRSAISPGDMSEVTPSPSKGSSMNVPPGGIRNIRSSCPSPPSRNRSRAGSARISSMVLAARNLGLSSVCSARDDEANMPLFYVTD